ncbi:hypothetical protein TIFTF001_010364 [Ficus carica]|uniref:Uncharacterized protein n=1 Tax=Ficus carica TaxID=3494 RepID=A0AA88DHN8_FICCA|nr:hypothetical protein TIFTF001_010364 [Ficus carica]
MWVTKITCEKRKEKKKSTEPSKPPASRAPPLLRGGSPVSSRSCGWRCAGSSNRTPAKAQQGCRRSPNRLPPWVVMKPTDGVKMVNWQPWIETEMASKRFSDRRATSCDHGLMGCRRL